MSKRAPRFEICRGDDRWWARFRAANGRVVFVSETYTRRGSAKKAVASIAQSFSLAPVRWTFVRETLRIYVQGVGCDVIEVDERA